MKEMASLLRTLSFIFFVSLLIFAAFILALEQPRASAVQIALVSCVVLIGFSVPVILLWLAVRRRDAALEDFARAARHLAAGDTHLGLEEASERTSPDLARAQALVRVELEERRRTYDAHRRAVREILDAMSDGVLAIDYDRRIRVANRSAIELFGMPPAAEGLRLLEAVRNRNLVEAFDAALYGRESTARSVVQQRGEQRQIEIRVAPLRNASTQVAAVALLIDLTTIEKLQSVRREFMADFHHEVRTPLAGVRLAVESLEAGGLTEEQQSQLRRVMMRNVARLERLVEDVGQLNEIESGDVVLHRERTDLFALVEDVAADFAEEASQRGVSIETIGTHVEASVDAPKIERVLTNLVDNAMKHSGSRVVKLTVAAEGADAVVRVIDEGEGIPPEHQDKVFHRFYRVEKSRTKGAEGTGLGLAIVKHLMIRHGGSVSVTSEAGAGTTFELRFARTGTEARLDHS